MSSSHAQYIVRQGKLSTSSTSVMSVRGDMEIQGTANHQGTMLLHNNLRLPQPTLQTPGTIRLVGTNQQVHANDLSLGNLSIEGGGTKQLRGAIVLQNELSLVDGVLQTNESSQLILTSDAQVEGGSSDSYVNGFLYHSGTGEKFYPIGNSGIYAPVTLLNVTGDNPTVGVAYFPTSAIAGPEFHWQQRVINGTYDGSAAQLTFMSDHADYRDYSPELVILSAEERSDQYTVLGQSSLAVRGNRYTIASDQPTAQPILSVGFDIPEDSKHLYLPNAFSTTAPHAEDRKIKVYGQKVSSQNFYLAIQDAWGTVVYQTTSWEKASTQGWLGTANASVVGTTYRYLLEGQYIGGKRFRKTGTIIQY